MAGILFVTTIGLADAKPSVCPTLNSLGITKISYMNARVPMHSVDSSNCDSVPARELCYVTSNLGRPAKRVGYTIYFNTPSTSPEEALAKVNNSEIFNILPSGDPDPNGNGCDIITGDVHVKMWYFP